MKLNIIEVMSRTYNIEGLGRHHLSSLRCLLANIWLNNDHEDIVAMGCSPLDLKQIIQAVGEPSDPYTTAQQLAQAKDDE